MYLAMLNEETLMTLYYKNLIIKLFEIYAKSAMNNESQYSIISCNYCIKIILSNFFEMPNISTSFYDWRFSNELKKYNFHRNNLEIIKCSSNLPLGIKVLEKMLYQNVPSLSSLKSVIKGFKTYDKGRIRHVTPFTHQTNSKENDDKKIQVYIQNLNFILHPQHSMPSMFLKF